MTDAERLKRVEERVDRLTRALLEPGADGDPPMIERMAAVVKFIEGGETTVKHGQRVLAAVLAIAIFWWTFGDKVRALLRWLSGA